MYTKKNRLFSNLSRLGIVQGLDRVEIARIVILNRLNLAGAAAAALVGLKDIALKGLELTILIPIFLFFVTELFLSHFRFHTFARYTANILLPLLLTTVLLLYGPESGTGYTLFVFITTAIIFHKDWTTRIALITFIIMLYAGSNIALLYYDPPLVHRNDPFDNIITFLGTSVAVSLMITYFFHENQKYETEQSQLLDSLKSSNTALKSANTELERFAYITSHDLRSPVRNISSFLGLAERDLKRGNYEHLEEYFAFAKDGAKQMNALIEDILEFTRLNQEYEPDLSLTDLSGLIAQCEEQLRATYGTAFQICAQNLPEIYTSPNLLNLLCMNLLDNAIKYNESEQPSVKITATAHSGTWMINFTDNGIGIATEFEEKIFEMFQRLHPPGEYSGTGIGLAICKKIANRLGGDITLLPSTREGSQFLLQLPIQPSKKVIG